MTLLKYVMILIAGLAPFAAIASLIGAFFDFGEWGWLLFMWFGFTGMFALNTVKLYDKGRPYTLAMIGLPFILILAFVGAALFALSDLPGRISVFYSLLTPLLIFPILALRNRLKREKV